MGNLVMFYDTETTGLGDFKKPWNDPVQPNLMQLGYKVYDPVSRETIYEIGHLVDTTMLDTWQGCDPKAFEAHGISEDMVRMYGATPQKTISAFHFWAEKCSLFVAHNEEFDTKVMQVNAMRAGYSPELFTTGRRFCTKIFTTNICKIPNPKGFGFKWPKLDEAYEHFFQKKFDGAHNALVDVNACADIFWYLVDRELIRFNKEDGTWQIN